MIYLAASSQQRRGTVTVYCRRTTKVMAASEFKCLDKKSVTTEEQRLSEAVSKHLSEKGLKGKYCECEEAN
jgi:hypothetical protein